MKKKVIQIEKAPKAMGPYSQAIQAGPFLFVSGQIPIDPATGEFVGGDIRQQTRQVLENIKQITGVPAPRSAGCGEDDDLLEGYGKLQSGQ